MFALLQYIKLLYVNVVGPAAQNRENKFTSFLFIYTIYYVLLISVGISFLVWINYIVALLEISYLL